MTVVAAEPPSSSITLRSFAVRSWRTSLVARYGYMTDWDNLAALPVTTFDNWWKKQIDGKTRNMLRRAEKNGVSTRELCFDDALVEGISGIYNESRLRQGKAFSHYNKSLDTVRLENGTFVGRSVFIGAFLGDSMIGFAKVVANEDYRQAGLMQIVSMIRHRDKAPTNALIAQAIRSCEQRGIPYLFYSHFSYGRKQRDSLSDFKYNNGFRRVDVARYYVPLTMLGHAAIQLGLYRTRLVDVIPESVQAHLRKVRLLVRGRRVAATERLS